MRLSISVSLVINELKPFFMRGSHLDFLFFKFIYFKREREREQAGEGQREGERENPKQALSYQHRA